MCQCMTLNAHNHSGNDKQDNKLTSYSQSKWSKYIKSNSIE